jgi:omega-amidase
LLVTCHGWKIRPFICYDLRFPIWTRNLGNVYDAAIFVANWPERRAPHWKALLKARAIENQCYVAGVNRVGVDGNGHRYSGDTCIIDPMGRVGCKKISGKEGIITGVFSAATLHGYRNQFPAWMDADDKMVVRIMSMGNLTEQVAAQFTVVVGGIENPNRPCWTESTGRCPFHGSVSVPHHPG